MQLLKTLALFCGFLAVVIGHQALAPKPEPVPDVRPEPIPGVNPPNCTTTTTVCPPPGNGSDSLPGADDLPFDNETLCHNFQYLRSTIDRNSLDNIIQTHNQCNPKFRKAMKYYNTPRFYQTIQQLQHSAAFHNIIAALRAAGVNITDIANILDIFACLEVSAVMAGGECDCKEARGHSFVGDVLAAMPHEEVHEYTAAAKAKRNNFARFVKTLNSPQFRASVNANLRRRDVARPLRNLQSNGWDVAELLRAGMTIVSW